MAMHEEPEESCLRPTWAPAIFAHSSPPWSCANVKITSISLGFSFSRNCLSLWTNRYCKFCFSNKEPGCREIEGLFVKLFSKWMAHVGLRCWSHLLSVHILSISVTVHQRNLPYWGYKLEDCLKKKKIRKLLEYFKHISSVNLFWSFSLFCILAALIIYQRQTHCFGKFLAWKSPTKTHSTLSE